MATLDVLKGPGFQGATSKDVDETSGRAAGQKIKNAGQGHGRIASSTLKLVCCLFVALPLPTATSNITMASPRSLEIVLLGATGYTGKLCAEHIVKNLPTNLAWGIAGRSTKKLEDLSAKLLTYNDDRKAPGTVTKAAYIHLTY